MRNVKQPAYKDKAGFNIEAGISRQTKSKPFLEDIPSHLLTMDEMGRSGNFQTVKNKPQTAMGNYKRNALRPTT